METDSSLINHLYCLSLTIHKGLQITSQFQSIGNSNDNNI